MAIIKKKLGFPQLLKLFKSVKAHTGTIPPVIDARDLQNEPRKTLQKLCEHVEVPFSESMLSWEKGAKTTDGPWKDRGWYDNVSKSTTFKPYKKREIVLPTEHEELYVECEAIYQELRNFVL